MSSSAYYLVADMPETGGPTDDGVDVDYWEGLREERILIQRCNQCRDWQWGPEWLCHSCHSFDMGWGEVAPEGIIYSWQRVWHPAHAALKTHGPYIIVLVELPAAGNVRVIGNLLGDPHQNLHIGTKVTAQFEHHNDVEVPFTLLQWKVAES